ncbi:MAG: NAD(P)-dependent alcohol dehydrogenase [Bacteroidia bacterium]
MKALLFEKYGRPEEVLRIDEIVNPSPSAKQVLVKIRATSVNDYDWSLVRGKPFLYRLMFGFSKPKNPIPGMEVSGVVEAVGEGVESLAIGDEVFGDTSDHGFGTFAEYICLHENSLIKKPSEISFEDAAAISHAGGLAVQALNNFGNLVDGQSVLINGGGGGVGTIALQLAKLQNCHVTGVDTGKKLEMMKSLGFDEVLDYKKHDFTKAGRQFDFILDCKSNRFPLSYLKSLKPKGRYVSIGGELSTLFALLFWGKLIGLFTKKRLHILALKSNKGLEPVIHFMKQGKLKCVIDGPHKFEESARLIQYFGEGKHSGKVVIEISN